MTSSHTFLQRALTTSLVTLCAVGAAYAQTATLQGHVTTAAGLPAASVSVGVQGTSLGTNTDNNGDFRIEGVTPGTHRLGVRMVGYATQERSILAVADQTLTTNFVLVETNQHLDEVVVSGERNRYKASKPSQSLRLNEPLLEAAQNIQVVTSQLLADQQIFNPTEGVTRNVSGVIAPGHWNSVYARITVRGFNTGFGSLRNGMNVSNYFGPLMEDMSFVERVEFVKGPGGFLLANAEPGGFYNVVTKTPTGSERKSAGLTLGSFGTYRATTDLDGKLSKDGRLLYRLNLMGQSNDSYQGYDFNKRIALAPSLKYQLDDRTTLTAQYTYQFSNYGLAGNYVFSPNGFKSLSRNFSVYDPIMGTSKINDHSTFLTAEHRFNDDWKVTAQLSYLSYKVRGLSPWVGAGSFAEATPNILQRSLFLFDVDNTSTLGQVFVNGNVTTGPITHRVLVGFDASDKQADGDFSLVGLMPLNIETPSYLTTTTMPEPNRSLPLNRRSGANRSYNRYAGVYAQDELGFLDNRIRLTLAGRYSNNYNVRARIKQDVVTPRVGLSGTVAPNTTVYALYDQAFVPQTGTDFNGRNFDPQRGRNIEAGVKRDWWDGRFSSTLTAYRITKTNVLTADPNNLNFSVALGEVQSKGIEADFTGELLLGLNVVLNYAYTDPEVTKDNPRRNAAGDITTPSTVGRKLGGAAKHTQNSWLTYRVQNGVLRGFGLSGGYQWQIDRYPGLGGSTILPIANYFRLDGGVSWQGERMSVNLLVNNLTNRYNYLGASTLTVAGTAPNTTIYSWQPEAPANFRLNVGYSF